jgi:hypothetical protein
VGLAEQRRFPPKIVGHAYPQMQPGCPGGKGVSCRCYTSGEMYAQKLKAEVVIGGKREPMPLEWLDSFCMRNFTGSGEFDDTLPTGEGRLEAGSNVNVERLAAAMSEWLTKRGKGDGQAVVVEIREDK